MNRAESRRLLRARARRVLRAATNRWRRPQLPSRPPTRDELSASMQAMFGRCRRIY